MLDARHDLPLTRQAELLNLSPGSLHYVAKGPSGA